MRDSYTCVSVGFLRLSECIFLGYFPCFYFTIGIPAFREIPRADITIFFLVLSRRFHLLILLTCLLLTHYLLTSSSFTPPPPQKRKR